MSGIVSISGGGKATVVVYGHGTVYAGNGADSITIGNGMVVAGNGSDTISVLGTGAGCGFGNVTVGDGHDTITLQKDGIVHAGNGNDLITIQGRGEISAGSGNDTLSLYVGGKIVQTGLGGHDTINLGTGNDTIYEQGHATIWGYAADSSILAATVVGGELKVSHAYGVNTDVAVSGQMTLIGSETRTEFVGGTGSSVFMGHSGADTFVGGSGSDTMGGMGSHNAFQFLQSDAGGHHVIDNFVAGDTLYVEGQSFSYLESHNEISTHGGNTYVSIDGGMTTIELKGFTGLGGSNITTHK